jgi:hypothetical protein
MDTDYLDLIYDIKPLEHWSGWSRWKLRIHSWLLLNHYKGRVAPEDPVLGASDDQQETHKKALEEWERKQLKGVNCIKLSLTSATHHIEDEIEIAPALALLEKWYKPSFILLYLTWSRVCLADCKDLEDYVNTFDRLYHELQDPEYEYSLPRIELLLKFVNGLGLE